MHVYKSMIINQRKHVLSFGPELGSMLGPDEQFTSFKSYPVKNQKFQIRSGQFAFYWDLNFQVMLLPSNQVIMLVFHFDFPTIGISKYEQSLFFENKKKFLLTFLHL